MLNGFLVAHALDTAQAITSHGDSLGDWPIFGDQLGSDQATGDQERRGSPGVVGVRYSEASPAKGVRRKKLQFGNSKG
jgi:hypothetical protein